MLFYLTKLNQCFNPTSIWPLTPLAGASCLQVSRLTASSQPDCRSSGSTSEKTDDWWLSSKLMQNSEVSSVHPPQHFICFGSDRSPYLLVFSLEGVCCRINTTNVLRRLIDKENRGLFWCHISKFPSSRSVCPWTPHSAGPQVPPDGARPPRRHRVWHTAAVERSNLWLTIPAVESHQLLQQVSRFIHSRNQKGWRKATIRFSITLTFLSSAGWEIWKWFS